MHYEPDTSGILDFLKSLLYDCETEGARCNPVARVGVARTGTFRT